MSKKKKYKKNWQDFNELILPDLVKKYVVVPHNNAYKIFTKSKVYNYYPKGEKINKEVVQNGVKEYKWLKRQLKLKEFEERFIIFTVP